MRYLIKLYTWYGVDMWDAEFDNHADMVAWYKMMKDEIENDSCSRDYICKVSIKCFVK